MYKINYFKNRIIMENTVYLLAKDVADALGFADLNSLKNKAFSTGYRSLDEYLEKVELPKDIDEEREKFLSKEDILHLLNSSNEKVNELVDIDVLNHYDLSVQQYIHIKDGILYPESFIAGRGIFFALYDSDYAFIY